jgi:hypothetical protein
MQTFGTNVLIFRFFMTAASQRQQNRNMFIYYVIMAVNLLHVSVTFHGNFQSGDFKKISYLTVGPVAQSVSRLATGWKAQGSNPGGGEIFHTCPDRPWGPPNLPYNGCRVFPGGRKRPGRDTDPSLSSSAEV